jgi:hypothetical protein
VISGRAKKVSRVGVAGVSECAGVAQKGLPESEYFD